MGPCGSQACQGGSFVHLRDPKILEVLKSTSPDSHCPQGPAILPLQAGLRIDYNTCSLFSHCYVLTCLF